MDRVDLIGKLLFIDNKQGQIVPLKFNRGQAYFNRNKASRNIVLKHRQGGWTASILADMYVDCITAEHIQNAVVSHETRSTQRLLDRVQFYYDTMFPPKPILGAESRSEKKFPELHSSIYIGTAGARAFGRGDTMRKVLLSEFAYYEDGRNILNAIQDAVPMNGELTLECTPNGENNVFFEEWVRAKEGKSPFKPFFFPWWWSVDYTIPRESELALPEDRGELSYTGEELELIEKNSLTEGQIRWRRWKIAEKQGLFWQEYPEDEVSCFISIGDPVFDSSILNQLAADCYNGTNHKDGFTYWIPPDTTGKTRYIIGADSAAGAPTGSYSTAVVLDDYWRVCATFQARLEPLAFTELLVNLAKWYNMAEIAIERNFTGYAVIAALINKGYTNIHRQRDFLTGKVTSNYGWWTNEQTKEHMRTALRDKLAVLKTWDVNLVRQLRSYRYIRMKPTAQSFDDLAIALMIAVAVKKVTGGSRGYIGKIPGYNW